MLKRAAVCALVALVGCDDGEPSTGTQPVAQGGSPAQAPGGSGGMASDAGAGGSSAGTGGASLGGAGGAAGTSGSGGSGNSGAGGSGNEQTQCLAPGELDCSDAALCCEGAMCITDGVEIACAALCTTGNECQSGCCAAVDETSSVCAPANFCPPPVETCTVNSECATVCCLPIDAETSACAPADLCEAPPMTDCTQLVLLAAEGTFLGDATSNAGAIDGVCNQFGQYGSDFSPTSIFNPFGLYGSPSAAFSAYNEFTASPPALYCTGSEDPLNPVTKNALLAGAIDPDFLCAVLAQNGL